MHAILSISFEYMNYCEQYKPKHFLLTFFKFCGHIKTKFHFEYKLRIKSSMDEVLDDYLKCSMNCIGNTDTIEELTGLDVNEVLDELHDIGNKIIQNSSKVYVFSDGKKKAISNELVKKYPESLLNVNMIDIDSRNSDNEIEIDFRFKYLNEIVSYMGNETDIDEFCRELMEIYIPFRMDVMNKQYNGHTEYGNEWKNRCVVVNGNE